MLPARDEADGVLQARACEAAEEGGEEGEAAEEGTAQGEGPEAVHS